MIKIFGPLLIVIISLSDVGSQSAQKDKLTGLWEVANVTMGQNQMTPVAKWFKINSDGSYQAGNGWLQNGAGRWDYNAHDRIFTANDPLDIDDGYGGFTVSFDHESMLWKREEEGMMVEITLVPIEKRPMSPADYLKGLWELKETTKNEQTDGSDNGTVEQKIFFRWDRIYTHFDPEGRRQTGYWHIHGHRPEVTLLPHQEGSSPESWKISVNKDALIMTGISDGNQGIQRSYVRRNAF